MWLLRSAHAGAFSVLILLVGCGGSSKEAETPRLTLSDESSSVAPPIENVQAPLTQLERESVDRTVDEGLGTFLRRFSTEPALSPEGEFQGFRIVGVEDREFFKGLGIGIGDVVTAINGQPIERPTEAYAAFVGLKTAQLLEIDYLRGGRPMRLSLPIVGEPKPQPKVEPKPQPKVESKPQPKVEPTPENKSKPASP